MKLARYLLTAFWVGVGSSVLFAQESVTIRGQVTDTDGDKLPAVTVIGNQDEAGALTDTLGRYELELSRRDTITLTFQYPQYKTKTIDITDAAGPSLTRDVVLDFYATSEVVVESEKIPITANEVVSSVDIVQQKDVDQFAPADDIQEVLQQVPGVSIKDEQPSIRGSSGFTFGVGSRVITLLNGLPMISANLSDVSFKMLPTDNIKQIEVFKGAASVLHGAGAMGGVINVVTRDPADTPRTVVRAGTQVFDAPREDSADFDGRSSAISPNIHFFHSRKIGNLDFTTQVDMIKETGYRQNEFRDRFRILNMFKYHIPTNNENVENFYIGFNGQYSIDSSTSVLAWRGYPQGALQAGPGFISRQLLTRWSLDPSIVYETRRLRLQYQGRVFGERDRLSSPQTGNSVLYYNNLQALYKLNEKVSVVGGATYQFNDVESDSAFGEATSDHIAPFLQAQLKIGKLNLLAGVRYQWEWVEGTNPNLIVQNAEGDSVPFSQDKQTVNEPIFRIGANYRIFQGTFLRASFGQAIRSPSITERFTTTAAGPILVSPADPDIKIEEGFSVEGGIRQVFALGDRFSGFIDGAGFMMDFDNMVEFFVDNQQLVETGNLTFKAQNLSEARIIGGEINYNLRYQFSNDFQAMLTGGVTHTIPIDRNGADSLNGDDDVAAFTRAAEEAVVGLRDNLPTDRPRTLKYRSRWIIRNSLDFSYQGWTFSTKYRFTSEIENVDMFFLIPELIGRPVFPGTKRFRDEHGGWHEVDFILARRLNAATTLSFHVFNATNTESMPVPGNLAKQRRFAVQVKFDL